MRRARYAERYLTPTTSTVSRLQQDVDTVVAAQALAEDIDRAWVIRRERQAGQVEELEPLAPRPAAVRARNEHVRVAALAVRRLDILEAVPDRVHGSAI